MISTRKKVVRSLVLLLVFSLTPVYMLASLMTRSTLAQDAPAAAVPMVGRLEVHRGKHINVDNNDAESGHTILDGQTLETSSCTTASVHFMAIGTAGTELGQVDLASNTKAVINYSAGKVKVTLERGCARMRVGTGIDGSIVTPDGKTIPATQPDTSDRRLAEACYPQNNSQSYSPTCIPPIVWIGVAGGAVAGTAAVVVTVRGENPSPGTPIVR